MPVHFYHVRSPAQIASKIMIKRKMEKEPREKSRGMPLKSGVCSIERVSCVIREARKIYYNAYINVNNKPAPSRFAFILCRVVNNACQLKKKKKKKRLIQLNRAITYARHRCDCVIDSAFSSS
ncbi:hypothetical protein PUN28_013753 [Cardiocondyla obscurior]|uniref:Ribosomal protein S7 n=1 Tax=Cardiocondyla obscurior TaxID=286306 RepID=A0AAW2F6X6_9HYME